MDLLVVGGGAMGRWFARTLPDARVTVTDRDAAVARETAAALDGRALLSTSEQGFDGEIPDEEVSDGESTHDTDSGDVSDDVDEKTSRGHAPVPVADPDERYDLVCVAVPIPATETAVADHADSLRPDGALVDVTGAMAPAVAAGREHAPDRERLSLHPLFAPERGPGRIAAVPDSPGERTAAVRRALEGAGNDVFETTAAVHDRAMETVQATAHAAVLAFALAAEPVPEEFATPVFDALAETAATVTDGDPRVYADVQATFDGAEDVATAARQIADADHQTFEALYREANRPLSELASADAVEEER